MVARTGHDVRRIGEVFHRNSPSEGRKDMPEVTEECHRVVIGMSKSCAWRNLTLHRSSRAGSRVPSRTIREIAWVRIEDFDTHTEFIGRYRRVPVSRTERWLRGKRTINDDRQGQHSPRRGRGTIPFPRPDHAIAGERTFANGKGRSGFATKTPDPEGSE